jgi:hypothetical protein
MIRLPICFEEMQKPRDLKQMARPIAHPSQLQLCVVLTRDPECLDQRCNPGAVDVSQICQVNREHW